MISLTDERFEARYTKELKIELNYKYATKRKPKGKNKLQKTRKDSE